nr:putative integron gene cassette protein [uncultured bacterium]
MAASPLARKNHSSRPGHASRSFFGNAALSVHVCIKAKMASGTAMRNGQALKREMTRLLWALWIQKPATSCGPQSRNACQR